MGYFTQTGMFETDVDKIKEHETIQALLAASPDVAKGLYKEGYNSESEDIAKGVFIPVSSLPQREPQKGAKTA